MFVRDKFTFFGFFWPEFVQNVALIPEHPILLLMAVVKALVLFNFFLLEPIFDHKPEMVGFVRSSDTAVFGYNTSILRSLPIFLNDFVVLEGVLPDIVDVKPVPFPDFVEDFSLLFLFLLTFHVFLVFVELVQVLLLLYFLLQFFGLLKKFYPLFCFQLH